MGSSSAGNGAFSGPAGDRDASALWVDVSPILSDWSAAKDAQLAGMICSRLAAGESEGHLAAEVAKGDPSILSDITLVLHAAEWHYCPSYY